MKTVTVGSRWWGGTTTKFVVIDVITIEGHTWVHYRDDAEKAEPKEYSCYVESFLQRFKELPE